EGQLGGLLRHFEFVDRLRKQDWPIASIDLGSLVKDPSGARGGFEQAKIKFTVALEALTTLGSQALVLSPDDLKIGVGEVLAQYLNLTKGPKVLAGNVQPAAGFEQILVPSLVTQTGPIKLGITAVVDPESLAKLSDPDR